MPATHILFMPEDVIGASSIEFPTYGVVTSVAGPLATVAARTDPRTTIKVRRSAVSERAVPASEFDAGAPGEWLRKPVVGHTNGVYVYGQVVAYRGSSATIRTGLGDEDCSISTLTETAPVLCFLKGWSRIRSTETSSDDLTEQDNEVLDRLLGAGGRSPTRSIQRLLRGFIPARSQPQPRATLPWVNASTGISRTVRVRHAIDFGYYIDGQRSVPSRARSTIGESFDSDPEYPAAADPSTRTSAEENAAEDSRLDAILDSLPTPGSPVRIDGASILGEPRSPSAMNHTKLLAAIGDDPDLIRFYLSLCQSSSSKRSATSTADPREPQRRRVESPSDLIDEGQVRRSRHEFSPTPPQRQVNDMLTAQHYEGKDPTALVDIMISSRATKFQPHPVIIARLFAFEFGARGVSVLHFRRFDFAARRAWYAAGSVNLNNFSVAVPLPRASRLRTIEDISNALTVLHVFAEEFFEDTTRRLISAAREFVEELSSFCRWTSQDVESLVFWFDRVFEIIVQLPSQMRAPALRPGRWSKGNSPYETRNFKASCTSFSQSGSLLTRVCPRCDLHQGECSSLTDVTTKVYPLEELRVTL